MLVSDRAISLANSSAFADARQGFVSDAAFVDQIDYQLDYRSRVDYLSSDHGHLAQLLAERPLNFGISELGLYLEASELAEMERRAAAAERIELIVAELTGYRPSAASESDIPDYGPLFAGVMQDQMDGGKIVLAVTRISELDAQRLHDLAGGESFLKIIEQKYSFNELEAYRQTLGQELDTLKVPRNITAVWSETGRALEVRVTDPQLLSELLESDVPHDAFTIVFGEPPQLSGAPNTTHSFADQQPGLRVQMAITDGPDGICTWGHNGHTGSYHYIVTAGHCFKDHMNTGGAWMGETINIWQNGSSSRNVTPGDAFLLSIKNSSYDVARISSTYANDNCYHAAGHCSSIMKNRALDNSWEVGADQTCASLGRSGAYRCGFITDLNVNSDQTATAAMTAIVGDSGSGMKFQSRIDGILSGIVTGTV